MLTHRSSYGKRCLYFILPVVTGVVILLLLLGGMHQTESVLAAPVQAVRADQIAAGQVITIGVQADLSGGAQFAGWRQLNAAQMAVAAVNQAGGLDIGGTPYTVTLVYADSQCNPTQAITAAQTLLDLGVVAVLGDTCSGATLAIEPIYAAEGIPMVSASATGPDVTEQGYTNTFRVITRDDTWTTRLASTSVNLYGMQSAAIIEMDGFWGNWASEAFSNTFTSLSGTITSRHTLTSTAAFTDVLTQIQAEGAHSIYFPYTDGSAAGLLARIAHDLGMTDTPLAWYSMDGDSSQLAPFEDAAGEGADMNFVMFNMRGIADMPGYADFNAAYQAEGFPNFGDEAQSVGALAYDAANIILDAIDRADSTDPQDIRDKIASTHNYEGVVGTYTGFDDKGDVVPQWGDILRRLNGEWLSQKPDSNTLPVFDFTRTDDFVGEELAPAWTWTNMDAEHWSLSDKPGYLRILLQPEQGVSMLLRPVPQGDFELQTSLIFTPTANFQFAGLMLYQDISNTLSLGRAFCGFGYPFCAGGDGVYFDHIEDDTMVGDNFAMRAQGPGTVYLRLIRQGNRYTAYVSGDGAEWWLVGQHVTGAGVQFTHMGLVTRGAVQEEPGIPADFDLFRSSAGFLSRMLPIVVK